MTKIEVTKCDCCGIILHQPEQVYSVHFASKRFFDVIGQPTIDIKEFEFCDKCSNKIVESLNIIAKKARNDGK